MTTMTMSSTAQNMRKAKLRRHPELVSGPSEVWWQAGSRLYKSLPRHPRCKRGRAMIDQIAIAPADL